MNYGKRKLPNISYPLSVEADVGSCGEPTKDETVKRKFRNLNEKKRRDQFNMLINELAAMVCPDGRRVDKTAVLERTIHHLKVYKESETSLNENVPYTLNWKPSFLSHDEFAFVILEAMNCVGLTLNDQGTITYTSDLCQSKLELAEDLVENGRQLREFIRDTSIVQDVLKSSRETANFVYTVETLLTSDLGEDGGPKVQPVRLFAVPDAEPQYSADSTAMPLCNCVLQRITPKMTEEHSQSDDVTFKGIYSLDWRILQLEDKAAAVLGYQPHELLGTSGYNYYHPQDIGQIALAHKKLLQAGCCKTAPYRVCTRGQRWVWLQSDLYMCYDQWNVKPLHIKCTHSIPSKEDIRLYKSKKGVPEYTAATPTAKRPRLHQSLAASGSESLSQFRTQPDIFSSHLAASIHRDRELKFGRQSPKNLPSRLLRKEETLLPPPANLNPVQMQLHLQLQTKYKALKANLERQQDELAELFDQLNTATAIAQSPSEFFNT